MDCVVTPLKTLMVFSVHLNVQLKFYNLPYKKHLCPSITCDRDVFYMQRNRCLNDSGTRLIVSLQWDGPGLRF
ncbi:hypothetical protein DIS17_05435 [Levilactobacillus brevis]|uniref:Uncharacterized protein n=1 Tax=Levilactobacillus brevis TaxID=1580 RepID=A0AAJ5KBI9_LEVBR|nr:hypothetical protein CCS05_10560 [Levilactobacillus brevis]RAY09058.1 hypothetical protein DN391_08490 [Levilactobacillus brevis]TOZ04400.1 hypothetical protein DIS17_05435 [Levilactobacillus brevis]